jgi:methyl-accepting chemotaxis protein/methyl-accepting chemotaxis protein-1 (serine sensor receptor)
MLKLGLNAKIWSSISVFAVGFVALLALMQWTGSESRVLLGTASDSLFPAALSSQEASASFQKMMKRYADAVVLQDKNALEAAGQDANAVATALEDVRSHLPQGSQRQSDAAHLIDQFNQLQTKARQVYAAVIANPDSSDSSMNDIASLAQESKRVDGALQELRKNITLDFQSELADVASWSQRQRNFGLLLFLLVVISSVLLVYKLIVVGVTRLLTVAVEELSQGANQVANAADQISSTSQGLAQGASEQAASLQETSTSAQKVNTMTKQNADNSRKAADLMSSTAREVEGANRKLAEMVSSMNDINSSSEKISKIIKVIDDIAFQTNILALNAAVEAARAGEAGMGFAVVADEVRNLAQRCAQAAKDTSNLIQESISKTQEGSHRLDAVEQAITSITRNAAEAQSLVDAVSSGSQEQAHQLEQITVSISEIEVVTQRSAASAEESASASHELSAQSSEMNQTVLRLVSLIHGGAETEKQVSVVPTIRNRSFTGTALARLPRPQSSKRDSLEHALTFDE